MTTIAVDARQAYRADRRGIGNTLVLLLRELVRVRPEWRFRLFHQTPAATDPFADLPSISRKQIDIPAGDHLDLWERVRLPLAAWLTGSKLLFCPANTGPRRSLVPRVVMVHDLIPLEIDPDSAETKAWFRKVQLTVRGAAHVLTVSEYSKGRIVPELKVPSERVTVVRWAPDPGIAEVTDPDRLQAVKAKYGLRPDERFAFGFGAADPRKNTARLIEAFAGIRTEAKLLLVGVQKAALDGFRKLAGPNVILHGFADAADLPALLSAADVLCFPSMSEGFGLPLLEAFACGTAVLSGDRTSLPEVAGDAAVLVNPESTDAIRDGLVRLLSDGGLRAELVAKGRARLAEFTWGAAATVAAGVFERVLGKR